MRDPDKPQQIIDAAVRVFARYGFYNSRVSDIAREAGIASGTIYLYFKTKDEILVTLFREKMAGFVSALRKEIAGEPEAPAKLRRLVRLHFETLEAHPDMAEVVQVELRQGQKFFRGASAHEIRVDTGTADADDAKDRVEDLRRRGRHRGLAGEFSVGICRLPIWVVLEHGHSLDRRLGEAHGLRDPRGEDAVAEVLLQELDRLLRVNRPRVDQRRQDPLDLDVRVEVLADHRHRVLELDQPPHRQILALHGDDH